MQHFFNILIFYFLPHVFHSHQPCSSHLLLQMHAVFTRFNVHVFIPNSLSFPSLNASFSLRHLSKAKERRRRYCIIFNFPSVSYNVTLCILFRLDSSLPLIRYLKSHRLPLFLDQKTLKRNEIMLRLRVDGNCAK